MAFTDDYAMDEERYAPDVAGDSDPDLPPLTAGVYGATIKGRPGMRYAAEVGRDFGQYDPTPGSPSRVESDRQSVLNRMTFRTPYRASAAASAMVNRRNEGRDPRTGRGQGRPY